MDENEKKELKLAILHSDMTDEMKIKALEEIDRKNVMAVPYIERSTPWNPNDINRNNWWEIQPTCMPEPMKVWYTSSNGNQVTC